MIHRRQWAGAGLLHSASFNAFSLVKGNTNCNQTTRQGEQYDSRACALTKQRHVSVHVHELHGTCGFIKHNERCRILAASSCHPLQNITSICWSHAWNVLCLIAFFLRMHHVAGGKGQRDPDPPCSQDAARGAREEAGGKQNSGGPHYWPRGTYADPQGTGSAAGQLMSRMLLHMQSRDRDMKCHMMHVDTYDILSLTALLWVPHTSNLILLVCIYLAE